MEHDWNCRRCGKYLYTRESADIMDNPTHIAVLCEDCIAVFCEDCIKEELNA